MSEPKSTFASLGFPGYLLIPSLSLLTMPWLWQPASGLTWTRGLIVLAAGLAAWTLLEYLLHRFVLHGVEPFKDWHRQHHLNPEIPMRIPVVFSLALVIALIVLPALLAAPGISMVFSSGLLLGHLLQESVHHDLHKPASGSWFVARWRDHDLHHHSNSCANYGTLTGFWDSIFRTRTGQ